MKVINLFLILFSTTCFAQVKKEISISDFFNVMSEFECIDSIACKFDLTTNYSVYNKEIHAPEYKVPDDLPHSDFYSAYAGRFFSAFYYLVRSDTTTSLEKLLTNDNCDELSIKKKVIDYLQKQETLNEIIRVAQTGFYDAQSINKPTFSIDSLLEISTSYFDIFYLRKQQNFGFHRVCGTHPIDFKPENAVEFLMCEFCEEALRNPDLFSAHSTIVEDLMNLIRAENSKPTNPDGFQKIITVYEPLLYERLKENEVLKKSLIDYYEKRKNIESFILEY